MIIMGEGFEAVLATEFESHKAGIIFQPFICSMPQIVGLLQRKLFGGNSCHN